MKHTKAQLCGVLAAYAAAILIVAVYGFKAHGQTTRPAPAFQIGAWQVPVEDVAKWQARGVNTFMGPVDYGGRMSQEEWERRVADQGGTFITEVGADPAAQARQKGRVGFLQKDEPDLSSHVDKPGYTPPEFRFAYERATATGLPVYLTAGAMDNEWYDGRPKPQKTDGSKYGHRAENFGWFAWCDVAGFDFYLYTHGRGKAQYPVIERCLDRAHEWSGGKPVYLFVETCTQGKGYAMTADQWEDQVMHAVNYCRGKGYRLAGVYYFSHVVFPWWQAFDGTTPEVAARMPVVNARLRQTFDAPMPATRPAPPPPATQPTPAEQRVAVLENENAALRLQRQQLLDGLSRIKQALDDLQQRN